MKILKHLVACLAILLAPALVQAQCQFAVTIINNSAPCDSVQILEAVTTGGSNPVSYQWSTGDTSQFIFAFFSPATFTVTATDAQGCTATATQSVVPQGSGMTLNATITQGCNSSGQGGSIDLNISGGVPPYSISWNTGETSSQITNLPGGGYWVQVEDAQGCFEFDQYSVQGINVSSQVTPASCQQDNGEISLGNTGSGTYNYIWSTGATTPLISGLASGWYGVTVSDVACTYIEDFFVDYDPNCQTIIRGTVFNSTGAACVAGLPVMTQGWVRLETATGQLIEMRLVNSMGQYEFRNRVPGSYNLQYLRYFGGAALSVVCPNTGVLNITTTANGGINDGNDFYAEFPNTNDIYVSLFVGQAVPGFAHRQTIYICNNGGISASNATINYSPDAVLGAPMNFSSTAGSAWFTVNSSSAGSVNISYSLQPGTCRGIRADFIVPIPTALGTVLNNTVDAPYPNDDDLSNNSSSTPRIVVGSYDPNDKRMMRHRTGDEYTGTVLPGDNTFEYVIRFQNTGTAPARRVVLRDTLESNLKVETLRSIIYSHNGSARIEEGNILIFEFNDINLPDSASDPAGSIGSVRFLIDREAGLPLNTIIDNGASIYFDFNDPIHTNRALSTIFEPTSTRLEQQLLPIRSMPNPFNEQINIEFALGQAGPVRISLFNALGQEVYSQQSKEAAGEQLMQIATPNLATGIYTLRIETADGQAVQKLIKQ